DAVRPDQPAQIVVRSRVAARIDNDVVARRIQTAVGLPHQPGVPDDSAPLHLEVAEGEGPVVDCPVAQLWSGWRSHIDRLPLTDRRASTVEAEGPRYAGRFAARTYGG